MKSIILTIEAVLLTILAGCGESAPQVVATPPTTVTVSQPVVREIVDHERFTGRLEAAESVNLQPRVTGYLDKISFTPGQIVKEGALLFEIDPRPYQADLDRANGQVAVAQAAMQLAIADNNRAKKLAKTGPVGVISEQDLDKYAAVEAQGRAGYTAAKANAAANALNLKFAKIYAPVTGKISVNAIDVGNLVNANVTQLATIVSVDPIYVNFDVDEGTMLRVEAMVREGKLGNRLSDVAVYLGLTTDSDFPYRGTLNYVDPRVDPSTGTRRVRAEFPNKQGILSSGLFAKIKLPIGEPRKALLVTERALGTDQGQKFVYVVSADEKVEYRPVAVGLLENGLRVIDKGLQADEWVIVNGVQRVRPGVTVDAQQSAMPLLEGDAAPAVSSVETNRRSKTR